MSIIREFLHVLSEWGFVAFVSLTIVYFFIVFLFNKIKSGELFFNISDDQPVIQNLKQDDAFFSSIDQKILVDIPSTEFVESKPVRDAVFKCVLIIYLKNLKQTANDIISQDTIGWSGDKWASEVSNKLLEMVYSISFDADKSGVPPPVTKKFLKWASQTNSLLLDNIDNIGRSHNFNREDRERVLLLIFNLMVSVIVADSMRGFPLINGEINGMLFEGKQIEP